MEQARYKLYIVNILVIRFNLLT